MYTYVHDCLLPAVTAWINSNLVGLMRFESTVVVVLVSTWYSTTLELPQSE